jgi:hypothetical protein
VRCVHDHASRSYSANETALTPSPPLAHPFLFHTPPLFPYTHPLSHSHIFRHYTHPLISGALPLEMDVSDFKMGDVIDIYPYEGNMRLDRAE